jgi:hypothetical protein
LYQFKTSGSESSTGASKTASSTASRTSAAATTSQTSTRNGAGSLKVGGRLLAVGCCWGFYGAFLDMMWVEWEGVWIWTAGREGVME